MRSKSFILVAAVTLSLFVWESMVRGIVLRRSAADDGAYGADSAGEAGVAAAAPGYTPYHTRKAQHHWMNETLVVGVGWGCRDRRSTL